MKALRGRIKGAIKMMNEKQDKQRKAEEKAAEEVFKNLRLQFS